MAADLGTLQLFPYLTGNDSLFRQLAYTGRIFSGQEALQHGLVSKVFKTQQQMLEGLIQTAKTIAEKSPPAIWTIKQVFVREIKKKVHQSLEYMARINSAMLITADMKEAISSFMLKKKPVFAKL